MKIIFPIGSFYPAQSGGPNNTIYWITKALTKKKIQTTIVSTFDGITSQHSIEPNTWHDMSYGKVIYYKTFIHYLPFLPFFETFKQLRKNDVIHLTAIFYPLSWMVAISNTLFFNKKIVWSPRGELDAKALIYSTWKKKPILRVVNLFLKHKVTFHSTCDKETKAIQKNFGYNVSIVQIPNYIDLPELIVTKKKRCILYLGRIHPKKAIENLIEAVGMSRQFLIKNFVLKIAGNIDNDYGSELIQLVSKLDMVENVKFLGYVEGERKQLLLAEAYALIMPSHTENFGNVVVEALAQKTPVIASKGTPWEILDQYNAGIWVENSPESLVGAIDELLTKNPKAYDEICQNAFKLVKNEFDIEKKIINWIDFYKSLVSESE